jgi:hypothetical protein
MLAEGFPPRHWSYRCAVIVLASRSARRDRVQIARVGSRVKGFVRPVAPNLACITQF